MSIKELIRHHLESKNITDIDLGPGSDHITQSGELENKGGKFGSFWGQIRVKEGLIFQYSIRVISLNQELEEPDKKPVQNVNVPLGGRMNLIETVDETDEIKVDNYSPESDKNSDEVKIVFTINAEVTIELKMEDNIDR
jgi:hypothetical protein